jgi:hypothetical protein
LSKFELNLPVLLGFLIFCPALMAQNLLVNPGFEEPPIPGTDQILPQERLPGWTITGTVALGEIHRGAEGVVAAEGRQWIELDAIGNTTISQDVVTVQGQWYKFRMMVAKRPSDSGDSRYGVLWNGAEVGTAIATSTSFTSSEGHFQATGPTSRLSIEGRGTSDRIGDLLDYVELIPVDDQTDDFGYNYYLPQIVSGGPWRTSVFITSAITDRDLTWKETWYNPNGTQRNAEEGFVAKAGTSSHDVAGAQDSQAAVGWIRIRTNNPARVVAIFQHENDGFDASVLAREATHVMVAPFDNRNGFRTAIALANPGTERIYLKVTIRDSDGTVLRLDPGSVDLQPHAHKAFFLDDRWFESRNLQGQIEIRAEDINGAPAVFVPVGLRFGANGRFTTLPFGDLRCADCKRVQPAWAGSGSAKQVQWMWRMLLT